LWRLPTNSSIRVYNLFVHFLVSELKYLWHWFKTILALDYYVTPNNAACRKFEFKTILCAHNYDLKKEDVVEARVSKATIYCNLSGLQS
jgi:hypothetical protein